MPKYTFYNTTKCRVYLPGLNRWIEGQKFLVVDDFSTALSNPGLNDLIIKDIIRAQRTVQSEIISNRIEIPVVDIDEQDEVGGGLPGDLSAIRMDVTPSGGIDGVNTVFATPDTFIHDPPDLQISVYLNGQRLTYLDDFFVSGPSAGLGSTITLAIAPRPGDKVRTDYVVSVTP